MKTFLCIDAGTTKIKAALITSESEFIDIASKSVKVSMPAAGICEIDMEEYWNDICEVIAMLHAQNMNHWDEICGIGVCAQGDGAWLLDENGEPLRPAILWNDTRAGTIQKEELNIINEKCIALNTTPLFSGAFPIIMNWLKKNEIANYNRVRWVLHCKDWINYKFTGNIATDVTDASTAVFDIFDKKYCYEILDWLDIGEIKDCLPDVCLSSEIVGTILNDVSQNLKIPEGVPVITGVLDVIAAATGNYLMHPGQKGSILGTTLANFVVLNEEEAKKSLGNLGSVLCHTESGMYIKQMSALSGASSLDWIRKIMDEDTSYFDLECKLNEISIGSNGVLFLPYLFGERAPFRLPNASAVFLGLRVHHTKYDMIRAAYEGITLALYDCYQNLPKHRNVLHVAGGGAQSDFLCQAICDCVGEPVVRNQIKELGILGVSYLSQKAFGQEPKINKQNLTHFYPNHTNHKIYMQMYQQYTKYKNVMIQQWQQTSDSENSP